MRTPFALDFRFPADCDLGQALFEVETAKGQKFPPMFLTPERGGEDGWYMVSFFN